MKHPVLTFLVCGALCLGCTPKPRAPALIQDEPIYHNKQEGFKFVPPPNWRMISRSELPPGKMPVERYLVQYRRNAGNKFATLDVTLVDVPTDKTVESYLAEHGPEKKSWKPAGNGEKFEVSGHAAIRLPFQGTMGKDTVIKEVVAIRKGERVYFFTGAYPADDAKLRDQIRKTVASISW